MGRVAVPPAAELAVHVADHELRLIVLGGQPGAIPQVVGHRHLVDDRVEGGALVHEGERRVGQVLEDVGDVAQHLLDPMAADDGQAVGRIDLLGAGGQHLAHSGRPFDGIALHLLRVAGVGEHPDDEVAGEHRLVGRIPHPGVVVGLATGVAQLELAATDRHVHPVAVGDVRFGHVVGQEPCDVSPDTQVGPYAA